jgi:hypothetical protein
MFMWLCTSSYAFHARHHCIPATWGCVDVDVENRYVELCSYSTQLSSSRFGSFVSGSGVPLLFRGAGARSGDWGGWVGAEMRVGRAAAEVK